METDQTNINQLIRDALLALNDGEKQKAYYLAAQAARLAPHLEEPWLILAGSTPSLQNSIRFLEQALKINPNSEHARRGMIWAKKRLKTQETATEIQPQPLPGPADLPVNRAAPPPVEPADRLTPIRMEPPLPADTAGDSKKIAPVRRRATDHGGKEMLIKAGLIFLAAALLFTGTAVTLGNFARNQSALADSPDHSQLAIPVYAPVPSATSIPAPSVTPTPLATVVAAPTATLYRLSTPTETGDSERRTYIVQEGDTLLNISFKLGVTPADLLTANDLSNQSQIHPGLTLFIPETSQMGGKNPTGEKRIIVSVADQHLYAYQGEQVIFKFVVSTGAGNNTPYGQFRILDKEKKPYSDEWNFWMPYWLGFTWVGDLEDGIHALPVLPDGTQIWQDKLGKPLTFGCVVLAEADAKRLYEWAEVGTSLEIR